MGKPWRAHNCEQGIYRQGNNHRYLDCETRFEVLTFNFKISSFAK